MCSLKLPRLLGYKPPHIRTVPCPIAGTHLPYDEQWDSPEDHLLVEETAGDLHLWLGHARHIKVLCAHLLCFHCCAVPIANAGSITS